MIGQNSNNKATGYTAKECDAGIPISGRTGDTGTYEIIKVNADGSLAISGGPTPLTNANYIQSNPVIFTPNVTPPITNVFVASVGLFGGNSIASGLYRINPTAIFSASGTGAVDFILYSQGSNIETYISFLFGGVDVFQPTTADVGGTAAYWHNTALQNYGNQLKIAYNRQNSLDVYLTSGAYRMAIISNGGCTFIPDNDRLGFYEFSKIA